MALTLTGAVPASAAEETVDDTITVTGYETGQNVTGATPRSGGGSVVVPSTTATYPASIPSSGYNSSSRSWAGLIEAKSSSGTTFNLYCIDINTPTSTGYEYELGTWSEANVTHSGYVARILNEYYPNTSAPAGLTSNQKAAAVQAAIWYFSDGYVLASNDSIRSYTAAIVNAVMVAGPMSEPIAPTLSIDGVNTTVMADELAGPFTVSGSSGNVTVTASGATMYRDAAGTQPVSNGASVPVGTQIWLEAIGDATSATLTATGSVTVPGGSAWLYTGNTSAQSGQKLILAQQVTMKTSAEATARFTQFGSLTIDKTITGNGAGLQSDIVISVKGDNGLDKTWTIPAGSEADPYSKEFTRIPVGTVVTITETSTGDNGHVVVDASGTQKVTIKKGDVNTASLTNDYTHVGSLVIDKVIAGDGGYQDAIQLKVEIDVDGEVSTQTIDIAAGKTGTVQTVIDDVPVGAIVTVTEPVTGQSTWVEVSSTAPQTIEIEDGVNTVTVTNTYSAYGSLTLDKTITGPGAGDQGEIVIDALVDSEVVGSMTIPANAAAGDYSKLVIERLPIGTVVTITETQNGSTETVAVATVIEGETGVTAEHELGVGANTIEVVNTVVAYGTVEVVKTIDGEGAALQDDIVLLVTGDNGFEQEITIPAGTTGEYRAYLDEILPAGTIVTITETSNGANGFVEVEVTGGDPITVEAHEVTQLELTNTYEHIRGSIEVVKTIDGEGAGAQSDIELQVTGVMPQTGITTLDQVVVIPAGSTGDVATLIEDVPVGTVVTVTETVDGANHLVSVTVTEGDTAVVSAEEVAQITLVNTYDARPGSLVVTKLIDGTGAGLQDDVVLHVSGSNGLEQDIIIPAGTTGSTTTAITGIPAGTVVTVTETADGANDSVTLVVSAWEQAVIGADEVSSIVVTNTYTANEVGGDSVVADDSTTELAATGADFSAAIRVLLAGIGIALASGITLLVVRRKTA
ncbi:hypothetical protein GCM10025738_00040 [Microbacterium fluvii]